MTLTSQVTFSISIIIPTLNEEKLLDGLLTSLKGFQGIEVIVADGGSNDRTLDIARSFQVQIVQSLAGRGQQLNAGARVAKNSTLLFLHCDTKLPEGFFAQIHSILNKPGTVAGAFRLRIKAQGFKFRLVEWGANIRSSLVGLPYGDQAIFMKKQTFEMINGYPGQPFLEEVGLIRKLKRIGSITIAAGRVTTSPRRWEQLGVFRTTMINQAILLGYACGMDTAKLAKFYRSRMKNS